MTAGNHDEKVNDEAADGVDSVNDDDPVATVERMEREWREAGLGPIFMMARGRTPEQQRAIDNARRQRNRALSREGGATYSIRVRDRQGLIDFLVAHGFLAAWDEDNIEAQRAAVEDLLNSVGATDVPRDSLSESE